MEKIVNKFSVGLQSNNDPMYIVVIIDTEIDADPKTHIMNYIEYVVNRNDLFKKCIIQKEDHLYFQECSDFKLESHVVFDDSTTDIADKTANMPVDGKTPSWRWYCSIDETTHKCRLCLKINHVYADGYKLIKLLTPDEVDVTTTFRKKTLKILDRVYYALVGTIISVWICIKFMVNMVWYEKMSKHEIKRQQHFVYDTISLERIKTYTKKNDVTVSDFMMSVCMQSYKKYKGAKDGYVACPINNNNTNQENNMMAIVINLNDSDLGRVHEQMNCFKNSYIFPAITLILHYLNVSNSTLNKWYNKCNSGVDVIYTNMIAPKITMEHIKINNIFFFLNTHTSNDHVVSFNVISYEDNLNLIVSFKEGIDDIEQFKKCITSTLNYMLD